jgi:hypothetical protein
MSKKGTLQNISDDLVLIDGTWYDATAVKTYLPQKINVEVEFSADDNNKLQFIKLAGSKTSSGGGFSSGNKGKKSTFTKGTKVPDETGDNIDSSVWEKKDRRIARENALNVTAELLKSITLEFESIDHFVTTVLGIAQKLENWVYRDM